MATGMEIRAWARDNGFQVADQGRIAADVMDAYLAAHTRQLGLAPAPDAPSQPAEVLAPDTPDMPPSGEPGSAGPTPGAPEAEDPPDLPAGRVPRYTHSRMPGVLYLPGRGKVHLRHDRPGDPG